MTVCQGLKPTICWLLRSVLQLTVTLLSLVSSHRSEKVNDRCQRHWRWRRGPTPCRGHPIGWMNNEQQHRSKGGVNLNMINNRAFPWLDWPEDNDLDVTPLGFVIYLMSIKTLNLSKSLVSRLVLFFSTGCFLLACWTWSFAFRTAQGHCLQYCKTPKPIMCQLVSWYFLISLPGLMAPSPSPLVSAGEEQVKDELFQTYTDQPQH